MSTKIYGCSDDLIEFEGDVRGEVGSYGTDERERGVLLVCSDGTLLEVKYGKNDDAIWEIKLIHPGTLFDWMELCTDSNAKPYSDTANFQDGLEWVYAATEWEKVK
jgi:hypothetical protein